MRIILASQSPRRIELLKNVDLHFDIQPSSAKEVVRSDEKPDAVVMSLAFEKAMDIAKHNEDAIVLAFDTIVYKDEILGKPKDEADAFNMLKSLNGQTHDVFTGLSIVQLSQKIKIVDYTVTHVSFVESSEDTLLNYIKTKEPMDKAGAYGIQGFGALLIDKIDGDYYSVMGLPLSKLNAHLKKTFNITLL